VDSPVRLKAYQQDGWQLLFGLDFALKGGSKTTDKQGTIDGTGSGKEGS
jgi:hypothetical protein